jgi:hypothetical protein
MGLRRSIQRHTKAWSFLAGALIVAGGVFMYFQLASAAFLGNSGNIAFGYSTNLGRIRISRSTYSTTTPFTTFATAFIPAAAPSANNIQFVVNKSAPTRNERLMGYQLNNGRLYVAKCTGSCAATSDLTSNSWSWATPTIVATNTLTRAFDIAYEQLSGRAMVVYAGNTTGSLYYCIYDGTTWSPVSSCTPTGGSNDIPMTDGTTTLTGSPAWVRLIPRGEQFNNIRTNEILLAVQDTNKNILVMRWDGTTWVSADRQVLTTTGGGSVAVTAPATINSAAFDIGWETTSGLEMAVYANGTQLSYRTSTGSGWGSATNVATAYASAAQWVRLASDPQSNRMSLITAFGSTTLGTTATGTPYIWKTDNVTVGFTAYTTITMAQDAGQNISTAWEKAHSGTSQALFSSAQSTNTQTPYWSSWVPTTFTTWAQLTTNSGDIIVGNELTPSPNSDIMNLMQADRDGKLRARVYSGSAWGTLITSTALPNNVLSNTYTGRTSNQTYIQKAYQYSFNPYSEWSLNWRVYDDQGATGNPGVALAPEGITPQVTPLNVIRLRMSYAELSGNGMGETRKKLQYSSGAGCPDSLSCVWTDVAQSSSTSFTWRYQTGGLADNAAVPSVTLTGSTATGYSVSDGTAVATGDQHNAGAAQEYDYTIQNYSGTIGVTYYFRGYDYGPSISGGGMTNLNPIYREQILDISGTEATNCTANSTASVCTYPNVQVFTSAPQAPIIYAPENSTTGISLIPIIQVRTSDQQSDDVQYVVEWCTANSWPCTGPNTGGSFDQTSSGTNWNNKDGTVSSGNTYRTSGVAEGISSMGQYQVQAGTFKPSTVYYLRAKAIDPGGSNTYSAYSTITSFTTAAGDVLIQGTPGGATNSTVINGNTVIQ